MVLSVIQPEPRADGVVELLEHLLEKARNGEISSLCTAYVYRDGYSGHQRSAVPHFSILLGAIERMKYELLKLSDE